MKKIVHLHNIEAAYDEKTVLTGATFDIFERDYVGILGPNGGGKTTLMKVLLGMTNPSNGTIQYYKNGKDVPRITMGYLPQYNKIDKAFPISVYDVIRTGLGDKKNLLGRYSEEQRQQVDRMIERMELTGLEHRPISALSGGQMQRILLARALVSHPDILVLDEPNTYIDEQYQSQMYEMLHTLNQECAVVLVSHDIDTLLEEAHQVVYVNKNVQHFDLANIDKDTLKKHIQATFNNKKH